MSNGLLPIVAFKPPHQLSMALDSLETNGLSAAERNAVMSGLARLLMEAAGLETEEGVDDRR
jgi:hypothetical protein